MPDLSSSAVDEWLRHHQPGIGDSSYNEPLESVEPQIIELGQTLDGATQSALASLLERKPFREAFSSALAQMDPGRQLRILAWLAEAKIPDQLNQLLDESDGVLRKHLLFYHQKAIVSRLFSSERVAQAISACGKASAAVVIAFAVGLSGHALAQSSNTSASGCATLAQAAADGMAATIAADDKTINQPQSVTKLTCLSNFFNGVGLNVITNLLDPSNLLQAVEGKLCSIAQDAWQQAMGSVQCGLTVTGFNLGFGGLGSGTFCPRLSIGGGGTPLTSIGLSGSSNGSGLYLNGTAQPPTGYTVPSNAEGLQ